MAMNGISEDGVRPEMPEEIRELMGRVGAQNSLVLFYDVSAGLDTLNRALYTTRADPLRMKIQNIVAREFKCDVPTLSNIICKCPNTKILWLERNEFRQDALEPLESALINCVNLEALCLKRQQISDSGAKAVANVMVKWKNKVLKILYLGYCSIGQEGAHDLSNALLR